MSAFQRLYRFVASCVFAASLLVVSVAAFARGPLEIAAEPCFSGMQPGSVLPITVTLRNSGPSLDGVLEVRASSYAESVRAYDYPVSLPSGAVKSLIVYPATEAYAESVDIVYSAGRENAEFKMPVTYRSNQVSQIGLVGDEMGGLGGIPQSTVGAPPTSYSSSDTSSKLVLSDCYAEPESAPDRSSGYQALRVLVLTNGCERLSPSQWQAIQEWTLAGGSLILTGGAGATYLGAPAAHDLIPIENPTEDTASSLRAPGILQGAVAGPIALTTGTLKPNAASLATQNGQVLLAEQRFGAGNVLLTAFNPLNAPLRTDSALLQKLVALASANVTLSQAGVLLAPEMAAEQPYYGGSVYAPAGAADGNDPFDVQLPPLSTIAWIFLFYFLLAAPGSYFILRKIGRMNLAWVVGPALSIACACVFYLFTINLYQAGLSRRTAGVLALRAGSSDGFFEGETELFFPRGGEYNVEIADARSIETTPIGAEDYAYGMGRDVPLETVDNGEVEVPNYAVTNLAFRRLYYTQPIAMNGQVTAKIKRAADGTLSGSIENDTGWKIEQAKILLPDQQAELDLGSIKPGEVKHLVGAPDVVIRKDRQGKWRLKPNFTGFDELDRQLYRRSLTGMRPIGAYLVGTIDGTRFGPALGRYAGSQASVDILVSLPLAGDQWRNPAVPDGKAPSHVTKGGAL